MIYLTGPYCHPDPSVRQFRFREVTRFAAKLMESGYHVFSPITHRHPIHLVGNVPGNWSYWQSYCERMLSKCSSIRVLMLDGWHDSVVAQAELKMAQKMNLEIYYINPERRVPPEPFKPRIFNEDE